MKSHYSYDTPLGRLTICAQGGKIVQVSTWREVPESTEEETAEIKEAAKQLAEYFTGARQSFDLPLSPQGTEFQQRVWQALCDIPYGETRTYKQVAEAIGNPQASRAVGMANNRNPIMIIIPCHRVIGANGALTGYAGGLDMKDTLLKLEQDNR